MTGVGGVDRLLDRSPSHAATLISRGRSGLVRHAGVWHDPQDSKAIPVYTYIDITSALSHNTNCIPAALQRLVFLRLSRPQWLPDPPIGLLYADQLACLHTDLHTQPRCSHYRHTRPKRRYYIAAAPRNRYAACPILALGAARKTRKTQTIRGPAKTPQHDNSTCRQGRALVRALFSRDFRKVVERDYVILPLHDITYPIYNLKS